MIQSTPSDQFGQRQPLAGHQPPQIGRIIGFRRALRSCEPTYTYRLALVKRQNAAFPKEFFMIDPERLLKRFLRYVQVDTTAREDAGCYPSSPGQFELGKMLVDELRELGLADAAQSEFGIVTATIPATVEARGADDCLQFARRYLARNHRRRRSAAGRAELRRRRPRAAGRSVESDPRRRQSGAARTASAKRSSPPTARRCWAPTTRPAWRSSWKWRRI